MKKLLLRAFLFAFALIIGGFGEVSTQPEAQAGPFGSRGKKVLDGRTLNEDLPGFVCMYHLFYNQCDM